MTPSTSARTSRCACPRSLEGDSASRLLLTRPARAAPRSMSQTVKNMLEGAPRSRCVCCGLRPRRRVLPSFPPLHTLLARLLFALARAHGRPCRPVDTGMDQEVPLPNVSSKILAKVIEYCKYHVDADKTGEDGATAVKEEDSKTWDTEFVKVDQGTLFELILVRARAAPRSPGTPLSSFALGPPALSAQPRIAGCQLPQHQAAAGPDVPDGRQHDQGCAAPRLRPRVFPPRRARARAAYRRRSACTSRDMAAPWPARARCSVRRWFERALQRAVAFS